MRNDEAMVRSNGQKVVIIVGGPKLTRWSQSPGPTLFPRGAMSLSKGEACVMLSLGKHSDHVVNVVTQVAQVEETPLLFVLGPFPFLQSLQTCGHAAYRHTIYQFSEHVASSEGQTIGSVFGAINYSVCGPENGEVHQWIRLSLLRVA